jgi:flagellar biosynthetic protein FliO
MPDSALYKTFFTLLIAVGGLGGILFLLKRFATRGRSNDSSVDLKVISKLTLQPKNSIFVVKAGERTLLLGASDRNISTLADLTDGKSGKTSDEDHDIALNKHLNPSQLQALARKQPKPKSEDLSFATFLKSTLGKQ